MIIVNGYKKIDEAERPQLEALFDGLRADSTPAELADISNRVVEILGQDNITRCEISLTVGTPQIQYVVAMDAGTNLIILNIDPIPTT